MEAQRKAAGGIPWWVSGAGKVSQMERPAVTAAVPTLDQLFQQLGGGNVLGDLPGVSHIPLVRNIPIPPKE
jgi:hypothetical protein